MICFRQTDTATDIPAVKSANITGAKISVQLPNADRISIMAGRIMPAMPVNIKGIPDLVLPFSSLAPFSSVILPLKRNTVTGHLMQNQ
jgi:hypothetical protein